MIVLLLDILEDGQAKSTVPSLHFFSILLVLYLFVLNSLQPVVVVPYRHMIVWFQVHRFWFSDPDSPLEELCLVVVVDGRGRFVDFVKLDEGEASLFFCDVVDGYLYGLNFSEGVEEGEQLLFRDSLRQVTHIDSSFEVFLVHSLLIIDIIQISRIE